MEPSGPHRACYGTALPVPFIYGVCFVHFWLCKLCIFIVMFMYSYSYYVCSVLYILFSLCQLALFGYPD